MSISAQNPPILPPRKILVVVTAGGSTNSAPMFEVCHYLHQRGHTIEFATFAGREAYANSYPFVSATHVVGRAITPEEEDKLYVQFSEWSWSGKGLRNWIEGKKFFDSFWSETYDNLKLVIESTQPDFLFADFHVDAARDMQREYNLPLATMWPQWPYFMCPVPYIPGRVGLEPRVQTSEHASMWDRFNQDIYLLKHPIAFADLFLTTRKMRAQKGLGMLPMLPKPDHLVLVNSFVGLETPKETPPLLHAIGPILSDQYAPLDDGLLQFYSTHGRTMFVAFGTHVILSRERLKDLRAGIVSALRAGHIDGVVWAIRGASKTEFAALRDRVVYTSASGIKINLSSEELLENKHPHLMFVDFAPQRAVLAHPSTRLFFSHVGPSSANESLFHGVPMLSMGIYGDQLPRVLALDNTGVALSVRKETFTPGEIEQKVGRLMRDEDGTFRRNALRMERIAVLASRRKVLAADLIEEFIETRIQSRDGFLRFIERYPELSKSVPNNLYAVPSHDSLLDYGTYRAIMASSGVHFTEGLPTRVELTNVSGVMCTAERVLLLTKARAYFEAELKHVLQLGHRIRRVEDTGDAVFLDGERFDFAIDATWGHYSRPDIPVVYEPTLLLYYEGPPDFPAITLVDGSLCSVYPTEAPGLFTLSSVPHTPLGQFATAEEAQAVRDGICTETITSKRLLMEDQITKYLPSFPDLFRYVGPQLSIKTKAVGAHDNRTCTVSRFGRMFSVMSGKIDTVFFASERILSLIEVVQAASARETLSSLRDDIIVVNTRTHLNDAGQGSWNGELFGSQL
ncbi:udp-glucosyl transferase family protein [Colletotrichum karsti]|uniref:Udp-glucosyl transferase family protein n=1 Tax=Colletotrichum karsti TaxID=1095194 RepID=A0A9P6HXP7_9PEZI|nr:udp-glucosyl transferase family protein [Colletotrichum karsti]KAF9870956.1 udp-glucosyl transferase family protein [Colletotrichum karsti]